MRIRNRSSIVFFWGGGVSGPDEVVLCNARLSTTEWVRNRWLCSADVLHLTASSPAFKGTCSGGVRGSRLVCK
jgi:hypothetical protein